jgi:glucose-6-phosphate 1-dehydrogenase
MPAMTATDKATNCLIVIFGASGDLTKRKLIPSLYDLYCGGQMPGKFAVLGISRTDMSDDQFRQRLEPFAKEFASDFNDDRWRDFASAVHYHAGDSTKIEDYGGIKARMSELTKQHDTGDNVLFYLSMAPQLYDPTIVNIGAAHMVTEGKAWCSINRFERSWQRIIVEKPFGNDPESAAHLNRVLGRVFEEESIYRIDHYLGKETVQNLLVFRFANAIFEPIWNRNFIDHVQVTAAETVGVEGRGGYYDSPSGGAMRDMIQSHLLQVLAVIAMEPPISMRADDIRAEKTKSLRAVRTLTESQMADLTVRGQYGPGSLNGKAVPGYRDEEGTSEDSQTDTYAAMALFCDTWRWEGVPFYVRSGKRMARKTTEVVITFRRTPHSMFHDVMKKGGHPLNQIVINIQPDEGIRLRFEGKVPGLGMKIKSVVMDFDYVEQFKAEPPQAYATLLLDAMRGDQTLYKHRDEIESAWRIVQPVLDYWKANPQDDLPNYAAGTWGPSASDVMMARAGRHWHNH